MTRPSSFFLPGLLVLSILALPVAGAEESSDKEASKYTLRYKFKAGETLRWEVVHRALIKATVSGTTDSEEMVTKSVKVWQVKEVKDDGTAVFENMVESVDMRQKRTGRQEVRYNSKTDKEAPPEYATVPESVGVRLSTITLSANGDVVARKKEKVGAGARNEEGEITVPFPKEPIAVGKSWSFPHEITVPLENGTIKTVKTEQKFTLEEVKTGIATIGVVTVILTPINDPVVEAQLIQRQSAGTVRFDIDAGRVIGQQMDLDKRVVGFTGNRNPTSSIHYLTRFTEEFLSAEAVPAEKTADKTESNTAAADDKKADEKTADDAGPEMVAAQSEVKPEAPAEEKAVAADEKKADDAASKTVKAKSEAKPEAKKESVATKPEGSKVKK